ncbi:hypothetical protein [Pseudomonas putida]|uniref:hypothetical protein n=1 Tax=Pseudomonas putida TaxID=303 RepID=UPI0003813A34|nr:hypothetical protein [Pseudomonas putida]ANC83662.1 hypothetical protein KKK_22705 [Pseudomonas putida B6-2]
MLNDLIKTARFKPIEAEILIVQPGLSGLQWVGRGGGTVSAFGVRLEDCRYDPPPLRYWLKMNSQE